jgi:hypothetical protein
MQILQPFIGSIQQYSAVIADPDRYRPNHCRHFWQTITRRPRLLPATHADVAFDG